MKAVSAATAKALAWLQSAFKLGHARPRDNTNTCGTTLAIKSWSSSMAKSNAKTPLASTSQWG